MQAGIQTQQPVLNHKCFLKSYVMSQEGLISQCHGTGGILSEYFSLLPFSLINPLKHRPAFEFGGLQLLHGVTSGVTVCLNL